MINALAYLAFLSLNHLQKGHQSKSVYPLQTFSIDERSCLFLMKRPIGTRVLVPGKLFLGINVRSYLAYLLQNKKPKEQECLPLASFCQE
jgi:hypothetical protein